jgi:hypothetical protein
MSLTSFPEKSTHVTNRGFVEPESITGRDGYIVALALAYAILAIEALPDRWQERSNCSDMKAIFAARVTEQMRAILTESAQFHLFNDKSGFRGISQLFRVR